MPEMRNSEVARKLGPLWTLKLPEGTTGATLVRRELSFSGSPGTVQIAASDPLQVYVMASIPNRRYVA